MPDHMGVRLACVRSIVLGIVCLAVLRIASQHPDRLSRSRLAAGSILASALWASPGLAAPAQPVMPRCETCGPEPTPPPIPPPPIPPPPVPPPVTVYEPPTTVTAVPTIVTVPPTIPPSPWLGGKYEKCYEKSQVDAVVPDCDVRASRACGLSRASAVPDHPDQIAPVSPAVSIPALCTRTAE
jgi:hypothetical protein